MSRSLRRAIGRSDWPLEGTIRGGLQVMAEEIPDWIRAGRKFVLMVAELHLRGFQRLRIVPGISNTGLHWRCMITSAYNTTPWNGVEPLADRDHDARYTTADERHYLGRDDWAHATPSRFADAFITHAPELVEEGRGRDWLYAGWYVEMLHLTYPDVLPVAYDQDERHEQLLPCIGMREGATVPMPPVGLGPWPHGKAERIT